MNILSRFVIGLVLVAALFYFGARTRAPVIESDIQTRTSAAMVSAGFPGVTVATDGRDVTLTGALPDDAAVDAAGRVARETWGVRVVDNRIGLSTLYATTICKEGERLVMEGGVPTPQEDARLGEEAVLLFPQGEVDDRLEVRPAPPTAYGRALELLLAEVVQLEAGCVRITGTDARIEGLVRDQPAADRIRAQASAVEALGYTVTLGLEVPTLSDEAARCQEAWNERLAPGETVLFDFDSAELHAEGRALLDEIAEIGDLCPDVGVLVTGHTDSVGDREYNIRLSRGRAQAVVDYLVGIGVDADRLTPVGYGFAQPIADNATEEGRALNRRIEFRVREN